MIELSPLGAEFFEHGRSESCPIIDMHAHMFNLAGALMPARTPESMLRGMDRSGVSLALFCSHRSLFEGRAVAGGDIDVVKRHEGRFLAYYPVLSPLLEPKKDLAAVAAEPGYTGFKILCDYYQVPLSDPRHEPYFEYADEHALPVLCHTWGGSPYDGEAEAEKVLKKYRNLKLIAGHSFCLHWKEAIALAQSCGNLYLELTAVLSHRGAVDSFVAAGLGRRIVFGVDSPWFSYDFGVGALMNAEMTDEDRRDILYRNAEGILAGRK